MEVPMTTKNEIAVESIDPTNGVVLQAGPLQAIPNFLQQTIASIIAFLPRLISALIILIIGWIIGAAIGKAVKSIAQRGSLDQHVRGTPLGRVAGSSQNPVATLLGKIAAWFIYVLAIIAAADALAIPILSQWLTRALSYLPSFIAGLLIIVFGFIIADVIADVIQRSEMSSYTRMFADAVKVFLYFNFIVIGLATMGIEVQILYFFARAFAWGLAIAIGLGVGIAFGWGGKDYVSNNMDRWTGQAKNKASSSMSNHSDSGSSSRSSSGSGSNSRSRSDER